MDSQAFEQTVDLVARAQRGESSAVEALFTRYLPIVRQIVALRLGTTLQRVLEVDDVVQQTLLEAFARVGSFEPRSEGSFRAWMARIVESNLRQQWRSLHARKRADGFTAEDVDGSSVLARVLTDRHDPSPSDIATLRETGERIERALLSLSDEDRRVIDLRALCGMNYEEIANELSLGGAGSARARFSRAAAKLSALVR